MASRRNTITQTGVLIINGQQVENTFNGLKRVVNQYERQLRNLTPGTEEYIRVSEQLRQVRQRFQEVRQEIQGTNEETSRFSEIMGGNIAADFFSDIIGKAQELGTQLAERVQQLAEIKSTLSTLDSGLTGANLDKAAVTVQSIADTYKKDVEEIQVAVKALNAQTKDSNKSLELIKQGFIAGADASGEMLTQMKEYPTMMKDAKVSAEQMIAIMAQSEKMGVYDDKGIDAIKEGMLRVREGAKSAKDAMIALGLDVPGIYKKISSGALTYFDVLKMISQRMSEIGADSRLTGTAIADLFGGPGEDAGYEYLSQLKDINTNLDTLTTSTSAAVVAKKTELDANEKLNGIWVQLTGTATILTTIYSGMKSGLADVLTVLFNLKQEDTEHESRLRQMKEIFLAVIAVMASYRLGLSLTVLLTKEGWRQTLLYTAVQKAKMVLDKADIALTHLKNAAYFLFTGQLKLAKAEMIAFNAVARLNPIGLVLSVLTAATAAFLIYRNRVNEARKEIRELSREQKLNNEAQKAMNKQVQQDTEELRQKINPLIKILNDQNSSLAQRKAAYEQLVKIAPEFRNTVDKEYHATLRLGDAYGKLIDKVTNLAKKRALESLTAEKQSELIKQESAIDMLVAEKEENLYKQTGVIPGKKWVVDQNRPKIDINESRALSERSKAIDIQISAIEKKKESIEKDIANLNSTIERRYGDIFDDKKNKPSSSYDVDLDAQAAAQKEAEKRRKKEEADRIAAGKKLEDQNKKDREESAKMVIDSNNQLQQTQSDYFTKRAEILENNLSNEISIENAKRSEELTKQREYQDEKLRLISSIENKIKETKSPEAKADYEKSLKREREILQTHDQIVITSEEAHQKRLDTIREKWATKDYEKKVEKLIRENDLERKSAEDMINNISNMAEARQALSQMTHLKLTQTELKGIKTLEDAKKALRENADRAYIKSQVKLIEEQINVLNKLLQDPALSGEALEKLKKDLDELNNKKSQLVGNAQSGKEGDDKKVTEESDSEKEKIDILGFSAKDWEESWKNLDTTAGKIKGVKMVVQALSTAFQSFSQLQQTLAEREMQKFEKDNEKKKKDLLVQLNQGYINKEQYEKGIQLLEQETAKKKAEIAYKQAKTERAIKIAEIITNTSLGIMQAYSQLGPIGGTIAAVLIGTLGAIQLGTVMNTPLPEVPTFAEGGFGKDGFEGFTGKGFGRPDETGERRAQLAWLHEDEWTAPRWMTEHPVYSRKINELEYARKNKIKSFAEGGPVSQNSDQNPNITGSPNEFNSTKLAAIMANVLELLQYLKDNGIEAFMVESVENGKRIDRTVESFKKYKKRNERR